MVPCLLRSDSDFDSPFPCAWNNLIGDVLVRALRVFLFVCMAIKKTKTNNDGAGTGARLLLVPTLFGDEILGKGGMVCRANFRWLSLVEL